MIQLKFSKKKILYRNIGVRGKIGTLLLVFMVHII